MFKIPVENMPMLSEQIGKLAKKAAKLGIAPPKLVFNSFVYEENPKNGAIRTFQLLDVEGNAPIIEGWEFVGMLEPVGSGLLVKSAPGHELPAHYFNANPYDCDHCKASRKRNATFIVKNGDEYKQVGRSCLKDFTGHKSPQSLAAYAEYLFDFSASMDDYENECMGGFWEYAFRPTSIFAMALAAIERDGYVGSSYNGNKDRTKHTVIKNFIPPVSSEERKNFVPLEVTDQNREDAEKVLAWVLAEPDNSEFWFNLNVLAGTQAVDTKNFGYLCAGAMMYMKSMDRLVKRESIREGINSAPIGEDGEKVVFTASVISAFKYSRPTYHYNDPGVSLILTLKTEGGNLVKIFTSKLDFQKGDSVKISGKISECVEEGFDGSPFKGLKITTMQPRTRITLLEVEDTACDPVPVSV